METDSMVAGAELDARIAVEVMGLKTMAGQILRQHGDWRLTGDQIPKYSTDWSAAGEVLERMQHLGWTYFQLEYRRAQAWYAEFERETEMGLSTYRVHNHATAPLAICLAALTAVRAQQPSAQDASD